MWNFSSLVQFHISLVRYVYLWAPEEKFHIYARPCIIPYLSFSLNISRHEKSQKHEPNGKNGQ